MILLLVGAVGAADRERELGLVHLASGNLFRAALSPPGHHSARTREYMQAVASPTS